MQSFNYDKAFSRNIGWVTEAEQVKLRQSRIGIGGLGGVGGVRGDAGATRYRKVFDCGF